MGRAGILGLQSRIQPVLGRHRLIAGRDGDPERPEPWRADEHEECGDRLVALLDVPQPSQDQLSAGQRRQLLGIHSPIIRARPVKPEPCPSCVCAYQSPSIPARQARNERGALAVSKFKSIGERVWQR